MNLYSGEHCLLLATVLHSYIETLFFPGFFLELGPSSGPISSHSKEPSQLSLLMSKTLFKKCPTLSSQADTRDTYGEGPLLLPLSKFLLGRRSTLSGPRQQSIILSFRSHIPLPQKHKAFETWKTPAHSLLQDISIMLLPFRQQPLVFCCFGGFFTASLQHTPRQLFLFLGEKCCFSTRSQTSTKIRKQKMHPCRINSSKGYCNQPASPFYNI